MKKILITGGFGFIGSNLIRRLNARGIRPIIMERMDLIGDKWKNVRGLSFCMVKEIEVNEKIDAVVHLGADVDTTSKMTEHLWNNNVDETLDLYQRACFMMRPTRFIYASSGAIYGREEKDFTERIDGLMPTNAYAFTKWQLDNTLIYKQNVYGLRFMNVYGNGEAHKGNMKSIVYRAVFDSKDSFPIFKTGREDIKDGEQARDFVHVDDVCRVIEYFIDTPDDKGGLFNVGTGVATSFNEIADIAGLRREYVDMPPHLRNQYQFYTCANIDKLRAHGYDKPFATVREGVEKMRVIADRLGV